MVYRFLQLQQVEADQSANRRIRQHLHVWIRVSANLSYKALREGLLL